MVSLVNGNSHSGLKVPQAKTLAIHMNLLVNGKDVVSILKSGCPSSSKKGGYFPEKCLFVSVSHHWNKNGPITPLLDVGVP